MRHTTSPPPPSTAPPTALLNSATIAILEGSPLERPFGVFVERARVTMLGVIPSIVKVGPYCVGAAQLHAYTWGTLE